MPKKSGDQSVRPKSQSDLLEEASDGSIKAVEQNGPADRTAMGGSGGSTAEPHTPGAPSEARPRLRSRGKRKLYQDEIFGSKELSPLAVAIIDTPEFQRLAHIYQLGFTYVTFRGANHRRFEHCVGTYFMSRLLMRRIVQNHARLSLEDGDTFPHPGLSLSEKFQLAAPGTPAHAQMRGSAMSLWRGLVEIVSAAALLHDLGHVAAGHTLEDEFSVYEKHDGLGGTRLFQMLYGPRKVKPNLAAGDILSQHFGPIDEKRLPRPLPHHLRTPLAWLFEDDVYERFFADTGAFSNSEIRDLIYLILSFKETVKENDYITFGEELKIAAAGATGERAARIAFLQALYKNWSNSATSTRLVFHPFMADIISNTICADLLDYLVRDGRRLALEIRNNPRLQRYLVVQPESSFVNPPKDVSPDFVPSNLRLTINAVTSHGLPRRDTVSDLLDLMRERYHFAEIVYYHSKKASFSSMLAKSIELTDEKSRPRDDEEIYPAPWTASRLKKAPHITHLGDEALLNYLSDVAEAEDKNPAVAALVRRIRYRDEYRLLFTLDYDAANDAGGGPQKFIRALRQEPEPDAGRRHWEDTLNALVRKSTLGRRLNASEPAVLIYCPNIRMQAKEVAARVELKTGRVIPLNQDRTETSLADEMEVLNKKYRALWRIYLFVEPSLTTPEGEEWLEFERRSVLSTLVDTFAGYYGVTTQFIERGSRIEYVPWQERLDKHFWRWQSMTPLHQSIKTGPEGLDREIEDLSRTREVWSAFDSKALPITQEEYASGFALSACLVAMSQCPVSRRTGWPQDLRETPSVEWLKHSDVPLTEDLRRAQIRRLSSFAASVAVPSEHRNFPVTWAEFCENMWNEIPDTTNN